jgi:hypothetical protein
MSLLSRFSKDDPTRDWPRVDGQSPQVSLERQALETFGGRMPFGAPLDAARFLGVPDAYASPGEGFCTLTYSRWGLTLEWEQGAFYQVTFLIGEGLAEPRGPDGLGLSSRTTRSELLQRFGEPTSKQEFDDESIFYYYVGPLVSEYQLDAEGRLTGWDVYVN